jgi:hypothetical protein
VGDELRAVDEAVDTEGAVVVDFVDLVRALPNEGQLLCETRTCVPNYLASL